MQLRNRRLLPAVAAAVTLATAACVSTDAPSVSMRDFKTDVRVQPAQLAAVGNAAEALPSSFNPPVPGDQAVDVGAQPGIPATKRTVPPVAAPVVACPSAPPNVTPDEQPGDNVTRLPREGVYRWKMEGQRSIATFTYPLSGFQPRQIRNVTGAIPEFTFETVQPVVSGTEVTTWRVRTDAPSQEASGPGVRAVVGEPGRGVAIIGIERFDSRGTSTGYSFKPALGVTVVPLPIRPGEAFTSSDADPRTGATLQNDAQVLRKERVDACGKPVDGWLVKGTLTRSTTTGNGSSVVVQYEYVVAPQLGGVLVRELADKQGDPQDTVKATYTLGQLEPDPLPKAQR